MVSPRLPLLVFSLLLAGSALLGNFAPVALAQAPGGAADSRPAVKTLPPEELGDVYMARKMFREAIAAYKTGPKDSPLLLNKIGIAWHHLGDFNLARASYERALKFNKNYAEAINNVGTIFYAQKKYRQAVSRYRRALELSPERASYWSNLGTAYYSMGRFEDMMKAYNKAIQIDPGVFEYRGLVGTEMQDRSVGDRARYHFEMARLYAKIGKKDEAIQYLRRSFEEGFKDKDQVKKAPEFASLLESPEFIEVMALEPRVL